jgi:photosystem II stability/assembly factor-like uncharacterized protein
MKKQLLITLTLLAALCHQAAAYEYWTLKSSNTSGATYGVATTGSSTAYTVGQSGSIRKTTDGATTWTTLASGVSSDLEAVTFPSTTTGYAAGTGGKLLKTNNKGATWTTLTSGVTDSLMSVCFVDTLTGYAVGGNGASTASIILKTTDGGATWTKQTTTANGCLRSVFFVDSLVGYACGYTGAITKTTDGGKSWVTLTSGYTTNLYAVHFADQHTGYVAGASGTILKTTDGGSSWTKQTTSTSRIIYNLGLSGNQSVYAVGQSGTVLRTTDGENWKFMYAPVSIGYGLYSVAFMADTVPVAVGDFEAVTKMETVNATNNLVYVPCGKDNTIIQSSTGTLSNGRGSIYIGRTNQGTGLSIRRGLAYFDVASYVPSGATIDSVKVGFFILTPSLGDSKNAQIYLYRLTSDWGEGTSFFDGGRGTTATTNDATWLYSFYNTKSWNTPGGDFVNDTTAKLNIGFLCGTASSSQMTTDVKNWLNGTNPNCGWILKSDEINAGTAISIYSKETGAMPRLEVYYSTSPVTDVSKEKATTFGVYPNPASDYTTIHFGKANTDRITIYNVNGSVMQTIEPTGQQETNVNLSMYARGLYFIHSGSTTTKLIVK